MSKIQTIFRVAKNKENPYVMLNKKFLEDPKLSYRAKGILSYILSKPDHWKISVSDVVKHGKEGRDAIYKTVKELIERGFIKHVCNRENGKINTYEYIVYEEALATPVVQMLGVTETRRDISSLSDSQKEEANHIPVPEVPKADSQDPEESAISSLLPENPKAEETSIATAVIPLPGNPDTEKPTQVCKDFNNKLINNNTSSSRARCAIFELWEDVFSVDLKTREYETMLRGFSRPYVIKNICLIQEHHRIADIQSPFAFVYSCLTNGGYCVPRARDPRPYSYARENIKIQPVPKAIQRQWDGKRLEPEVSKEELAKVQARVREEIRLMYEEGGVRNPDSEECEDQII